MHFVYHYITLKIICISAGGWYIYLGASEDQVLIALNIHIVISYVWVITVGYVRILFINAERLNFIFLWVLWCTSFLYGFRYIPLKRFKVPFVVTEDQGKLCRDMPSPVLYEKVGQGASGATVHRCKFGAFTAAAKVLPSLRCWIIWLSSLLFWGQTLDEGSKLDLAICVDRVHDLCWCVWG